MKTYRKKLKAKWIYWDITRGRPSHHGRCEVNPDTVTNGFNPLTDLSFFDAPEKVCPVETFSLTHEAKQNTYAEPSGNAAPKQRDREPGGVLQ